MQRRKFAVPLRALILCALCCANCFALVLAEESNLRPDAEDAQLLKPPKISLQVVADPQVPLREAPSAKLLSQSPTKLGPQRSEFHAVSPRPRLKSNTRMPIAGAKPKPQIVRATKPSTTALPAAHQIPVTAERENRDAPAVSTAGGSAEDRSSLQQAATRHTIGDQNKPKVTAATHLVPVKVKPAAPIQQSALRPAQIQPLAETTRATDGYVPIQRPSRKPTQIHQVAQTQRAAKSAIPIRRPALQPMQIRQISDAQRNIAESRPVQQPNSAPIRQVVDTQPIAPGIQLRQPRATALQNGRAAKPRAADPHAAADPRPAGQVLGGDTMKIPREKLPDADKITIEGKPEGPVMLAATNTDLASLLRTIAEYHGLNLVVGPKIEGSVTLNINGATLEEVLDALLGVSGYSWHRVGNLLYVTGSDSPRTDAKFQGRTLSVYPLDYVAAVDVEPVANQLLTSVGTVQVISSSTEDQLKTREMLVVEDTMAAHHRIAQYIAQVDVPPRQVLIEAHVMQIALSEEERHGINWRGLARWRGADITLEGGGFANDDPGGPSVALRVDGQDMDSLIELIRQNTNSRTLASPKVSVVNHQEAKIQIGQRLPYSVATTTQTSTIQNVQFLDVGIVLTVTPVITEDGNVLMSVQPKVSGGKITENGFPEEDTTEVQTTVLMPDGGGIVIGGLIREDDAHTRALVPGIGRVPVVGHFFRRRNDEVRRNELVVALVTHVLPDVYSQRCKELRELDQTLPNYSKNDVLHPPQVIKGCYKP